HMPARHSADVEPQIPGPGELEAEILVRLVGAAREHQPVTGQPVLDDAGRSLAGAPHAPPRIRHPASMPERVTCIQSCPRRPTYRKLSHASRLRALSSANQRQAGYRIATATAHTR